MDGTVEGNADMMQRIQSSSIGTQASLIHVQPSNISHHPDFSQFNANQVRARQFAQYTQSAFNEDNNTSRRVHLSPSNPNQIPPVSPYSQIPGSHPMIHQTGSQKFGTKPTHSRSLSQPPFLSLDGSGPINSSVLSNFQSNSTSDHVRPNILIEGRESHSLLPPSPSMRSHSRVGEGLPPRKAHRRSNSDIPLEFSGMNMVQSSPPPLIPSRGLGGLVRSFSGGESSAWVNSSQFIKRESNEERRGGTSSEEEFSEKKPEGELLDDLLSVYMNLDNIDAMNSFGTDNKYSDENRDMDSSRGSGTKTNGGDSSENEAESGLLQKGNSLQKMGLKSSGEKRECVKRSAEEDITPATRHYRSMSMDSFMEKLNFGDESSKLPPTPGPYSGQHSRNNSADGNPMVFSPELANGEFTGDELKKIMTNEKLAEIASSDPKRVKRILANRQSAARSKERKTRYISELEHKVQTLQTEATSLSAQVTLLQRDSVGLANENNELKFRLHAMEQHAQLREALNETLTTEVQRLKLESSKVNGNHGPNPSKFHSMNSQMVQLNICQRQEQQQEGKTAKP